LLLALRPRFLTIPGPLLRSLLPTAFGYLADVGGASDLMPSRTGTHSFDQVYSPDFGAFNASSPSYMAEGLVRDRLALMTAQSVLVNAYLSMTAGTGEHSSWVVGQVRYHVEVELAPMLGGVHTMLGSGSGLGLGQVPAQERAQVVSEWVSHLYALQRAVASGQPFMRTPTAPEGAPI
ncbi:hypothetical protein B484DRAFT_394610, partial [Ochromonadaceae sp. CCMP2298]